MCLIPRSKPNAYSWGGIYYKSLRLWMALGQAAAAIDGINPSAFTILLLFMTAMLTSVQTSDTSLIFVRARFLNQGGIYFALVFLIYIAPGINLLKTLDFFTHQHASARFGSLFVILLGLWMYRDFFLPIGVWEWKCQDELASLPASQQRRLQYLR